MIATISKPVVAKALTASYVTITSPPLMRSKPSTRISGFSGTYYTLGMQEITNIFYN